MDDPQLSSSRHVRALAGLARLNGLSGSGRHVWRAIRQFARGTFDAPLRVLDVATGGGDIPIDLWRRARRENLPIEVTGMDLSGRAVEFARERAERSGADVRFVPGDALQLDSAEIPGHPFDVIVCSLFLHHLAEDQASELLRRMAATEGRLLLVNDLERSRLNYLLVLAGSRLVTRSDVVRTDGPLSVRAAFSRTELGQLAASAGWHGARLRRCRPCRLMLEWSRPR